MAMYARVRRMRLRRPCFRIGQRRDVWVHCPLAVHPTLGGDSFDEKLDALLER